MIRNIIDLRNTKDSDYEEILQDREVICYNESNQNLYLHENDKLIVIDLSGFAVFEKTDIDKCVIDFASKEILIPFYKQDLDIEILPVEEFEDETLCNVKYNLLPYTLTLDILSSLTLYLVLHCTSCVLIRLSFVSDAQCLLASLLAMVLNFFIVFSFYGCGQEKIMYDYYKVLRKGSIVGVYSFVDAGDLRDVLVLFENGQHYISKLRLSNFHEVRNLDNKIVIDMKNRNIQLPVNY